MFILKLFFFFAFLAAPRELFVWFHGTARFRRNDLASGGWGGGVAVG